MAKTKINKVFIIGTVEEVDTKIGVTSDSREYISGKVVVKSTIQVLASGPTEMETSTFVTNTVFDDHSFPDIDILAAG